MPRRGRRFNDLETALRKAGGVADPASPLGKYKAWKEGKTSVNVVNKATSSEKARFAVAVIPFNVSPDATVTNADFHIAPMTQLARTNMAALGGATFESAAGIKYDIDGATTNDSFYPALLRVGIPAAAAAASGNKTSDITGTKYTYNRRRTGSIPFGRGTTANVLDAKAGTVETVINAVDEEDSRKSLITFLKSRPLINGQKLSIAYDPEVWRNSRPILGAFA